jgi:hypothetical protein
MNEKRTYEAPTIIRRERLGTIVAAVTSGTPI